MKEIVVGSRESSLALIQSNLVMKKLMSVYPDIKFSLKTYKSKGDLILNKPIEEIGERGVFTFELEDALLSGDIDIAVHSMKDMGRDKYGLEIISILEREDIRDVLILKKGLSSLPSNGIVGTGSTRRGYQMLGLRPDIKIVNIRGTVESRISQIDNNESAADSIILAAAGLNRLDMKNRISSYFSLNEILTAPCQGAIAIEVRSDDKDIKNIVSKINHRYSYITSMTERCFQSELSFKNEAIIGGVSSIKNNELVLKGLYGTSRENMTQSLVRGPINTGRELGKLLAEKLKKEILIEKK